MKKLIINLIHFWDLKLYEEQTTRRVEELAQENKRLRRIIYDLSDRQEDERIKKLAQHEADRIAFVVADSNRFNSNWNTAFKP